MTTNTKLREALELAIRQNSHDMLMTGEEIRQCEQALALTDSAAETRAELIQRGVIKDGGAMTLEEYQAEKASAESVKCGKPAESTLLPNGLSREQKREFILSHAKRAGSFDPAVHPAFVAWMHSHHEMAQPHLTSWNGFEAGYQRGQQAGDARHCQCAACKCGTIHESDCAVHNMPSEPNGPCDCSVASQQAGDALTDEMLDAGGEELYGHPRSSAVEWAKEDKFDSCVWQAEQVWKAMCAARASAAKGGEA